MNNQRVILTNNALWAVYDGLTSLYLSAFALALGADAAAPAEPDAVIALEEGAQYHRQAARSRAVLVRDVDAIGYHHYLQINQKNLIMNLKKWLLCLSVMISLQRIMV